MAGPKPIGVFDSGLGGLTVLRELRRRLPDENFVYLGDVARLPYGTKSRDVVTRYAATCAEFLISKQVRGIVVACNTATAMALDYLKATLRVPVMGVIESGVLAAKAATKNRDVLVLATESTVRSEAYPKIFALMAPDCRVTQKACPLFVPLVEDGWWEHPVSKEIIREYLKDIPKRFDTVLLGCTHYPLLENAMREVVGPSIGVVHGGALLAERIASEWGCAKSTDEKKGSVEWFSTDHVSVRGPLLNALTDSDCEFIRVDL